MQMMIRTVIRNTFFSRHSISPTIQTHRTSYPKMNFLAVVVKQKTLRIPWLLFALLTVQPVHAEWNKEDQRLVAQILPTVKESAWLSILWRTNLWQARKEAAQSGKPIYLWEMDGHPLGCT
jgi:hypothetical protein